MSTPQPHLTIESHSDDWQSILAGVLQAIQVFGPFVIQLIDVTKQKPTASITFTPEAAALQRKYVK